MNRHNDCLILVADDDRQVCEVFSRFLTARGYRAAMAFDGRQALELFRRSVPNIAIIDVRMPVMSGLQFLEETRKLNSSIPVIITTGHPDIEGAIRSIQNGAFDYLVKPVPLELLEKKVSQALRSAKLTRENAALSELASLHQITREFAHTHEPDKLFDLVFEKFMEVAEADGGSLQLIDRGTKELVTVRRKSTGEDTGPRDDDRSGVQWVVSGGQPLPVTDGKPLVETGIALKSDDSASVLALCLRAGEEIIGVVNLSRGPERETFSVVQLNSLDVLASQAAVAIHNAHLYSSIRGQLDDLSLISSFSERLMGLIETEQIIECLFEAAARHFHIDIAGFLFAHRRSYEFLYWSCWDLTEPQVRKIAESLLDDFLARSGSVSKRRIAFKRMGPSSTKSGMHGDLQYRSFVPLNLEGVEYGGLFCGALAPEKDLAGRIPLLASVINQTRLALTNSKLYGDMRENYIRTIKALAIAVDAKDTYTHGHSENVMNIAEEIARELGLDQRRIDAIRDGGLLHDIGKIGIPGYILNKPGSLTYEEFNSIMKTHTTLGANIVRDVPFLRDLHELILYHHENFDGSGYPEGLVGEGIPLGARILHVADAFEAMTSNRPYRKSLGEAEALRRLKSGKGKQFDPGIVDAFLAVAGRKGWMREGV